MSPSSSLTPTDIPIGERIKFFRFRRTQLEVAHAAGISVDYLGQIERGQKMPAVPVLYRLAQVLEVPVSSLLGEPSYEQGDVPRVNPQLRRAVLGYLPPNDQEPHLANLRDRVADTYLAWHKEAHQYSVVSLTLPDLLTEVEQAMRLYRSPGATERRRELLPIAGMLYHVLFAWFLYLKRMDLAVLMAERRLRVAEELDDSLDIAAARYLMGHALLADGDLEGSEELAIRSAEDIEQLASTSKQAAGLFGALHLVAVIAAVRTGDSNAARRLIDEKAWPTAKTTGETSAFEAGAFGPINVAIHAMSVESEAGQAAQAIRLSEMVDTEAFPTVDRAAYFYLDLARAYEQQHDHLGVLFHLQHLEQSAPEFARYNPIVRDLVRGLVLGARRSYAPDVRALARQLNVRT